MHSTTMLCLRDIGFPLVNGVSFEEGNWGKMISKGLPNFLTHSLTCTHTHSHIAHTHTHTHTHTHSHMHTHICNYAHTHTHTHTHSHIAHMCDLCVLVLGWS